MMGPQAGFPPGAIPAGYPPYPYPMMAGYPPPPTAKAAKAAAAGEAGVKGRKRRKKIPQGGPKKPATSFVLFSNTVREQVKEEHPGLSFLDLGRKLGEMWREMDTQVGTCPLSRACPPSCSFLSRRHSRRLVAASKRSRSWIESEGPMVSRPTPNTPMLEISRIAL